MVSYKVIVKFRRCHVTFAFMLKKCSSREVQKNPSLSSPHDYSYCEPLDNLLILRFPQNESAVGVGQTLKRYFLSSYTEMAHLYE